MQGTELNPDFFSDIVAAVSKELGAVLLCNIGGKIEVTETNPAGTQSRYDTATPRVLVISARSLHLLLYPSCLCVFQWPWWLNS